MKAVSALSGQNDAAVARAGSFRSGAPVNQMEAFNTPQSGQNSGWVNEELASRGHGGRVSYAWNVPAGLQGQLPATRPVAPGPSRLGAVSPARKESLRRKFRLSESGDEGMQQWRRLFRSFNAAEDGTLLLSEFLKAVRNGELPSRQGVSNWSERELKELWSAVDTQQSGFAEIEDLVHFLCAGNAPFSPSALGFAQGQRQGGGQEGEEEGLVDADLDRGRPRSVGGQRANASTLSRRTAPALSTPDLLGSSTRMRSAALSASSPAHRTMAGSAALRTKSPSASVSGSRGSRGMSPVRSGGASARGNASSSSATGRRAALAAEVERRVEELEGEVTLLERENEALRGRLHSLSDALQRAEGEAERAGGDNQQLLSALAQEESLKEQAVSEAEAARGGAALAEERRAEWEQRHAAAVEEKGRARQSEEEARLALALECEARLRAEAQAAQLRLRAGEAEREEEAGRRRVEELEGRVREEEEGREEAVGEVRREEERAAAAEQREQVLRVRLDAAERACAAQSQQRGDLERRLASTLGEKEGAEAAKGALEEELGRTGEALRRASVAIGELESEVLRLGAAQVLAEEEAGRRQERVRMLEEANGVALEECTRRDAEARELMEQVSSVKRQLEPQIAELNAMLSAEKDKAEAATQRAERMERQLVAVTECNASLSEELAAAKAAAKELKGEVEALVINLHDQRHANLQVVKENRGLLLELRTLEERTISLLQAEEEVRKRLQGRVASADEELDHAHQEVARREQQQALDAHSLQHLKAELSSLRLQRGREERGVAKEREELRQSHALLHQARDASSELQSKLAHTTEQRDHWEQEARALADKLLALQTRYTMELERSLGHSRALTAPTAPDPPPAPFSSSHLPGPPAHTHASAASTPAHAWRGGAGAVGRTRPPPRSAHAYTKSPPLFSPALAAWQLGGGGGGGSGREGGGGEGEGAAGSGNTPAAAASLLAPPLPSSGLAPPSELPSYASPSAWTTPAALHALTLASPIRGEERSYIGR